MKWGLPCKIQPFLPKPTGDAEEDPNEVFDTMCSTSVSNVPACHSSDHIMQFTYDQALHAYPSLKCPQPSWAHKWNLSVLGRDGPSPLHSSSQHLTLLRGMMKVGQPCQKKHKPYTKERGWWCYCPQHSQTLPTPCPSTKAWLSHSTIASKWQQPHLRHLALREGKGTPCDPANAISWHWLCQQPLLAHSATQTHGDAGHAAACRHAPRAERGHTHVCETTVVSSAWDGFPSLATSVLLLAPRGSMDH